VSTAVAITSIIARTVLDLAFTGAGLKLALTVAPRFQIGAPKASQVRVNLQPETVTPEAAVNGADPAAATTGGAS
jgi:hypothetical protein